MTPFRKMFVLFGLCLTASFIASCASSPTPPGLVTAVPGSHPTAYAQLPDPVMVATLGPEIKRFSGSGNSAETTIKLDTKQIIRVNWKQDCISNFYLSLINADPVLADEDGGEIILSVAASPNYGYSDYEFAAGTYKINIESDGTWEVWVEPVVQEQEIPTTPEP